MCPGGYMVITFKMSPSIWWQCAQWGHGDHIHNVPSDGITMCSVGTCWVLSKCIQWGSQCPQWAHVEFFHNVPINVITMSPVAYIMVSFTMFFTMYPACPWATHWEFFQKLSSNVITMCSTTYSLSSLRIHGKNQLYWRCIVITLKEAPWGHCDHIAGQFLKEL